MINREYIIKPIAYMHCGFTSKFGIPRQSGIAGLIKGQVVFCDGFKDREALREIEGFSHLWLIWRFSETENEGWHPTVRPPRLGGNRRVGVFASRSPYRPNSLGLSCVRLESVETTPSGAPVLNVSGVDMLDGTPIFDIKPYIPLSDMHTDATEGYTRETKNHKLTVTFKASVEASVTQSMRNELENILSNDPRPGYANDSQKEYGIEYDGMDIGFTVDGDTLTVFRIDKKE